jgi:hypothetical protein
MSEGRKRKEPLLADLYRPVYDDCRADCCLSAMSRNPPVATGRTQRARTFLTSSALECREKISGFQDMAGLGVRDSYVSSA